MNAKTKTNTIVTTQLLETGELRFTVRGHAPLTFNPQLCHAATRQYAELHGWKQRVVDAAAVEVTDKDGNVRSHDERDAMKFAAMKAVIAHYESGAESWNLRESARPTASVTLQAIAELRGTSIEAARVAVDKLAGAKFAGDTRKALAYLRGDPKVAELVAKLSAPVAGKIDADSILDAMGE